MSEITTRVTRGPVWTWVGVLRDGTDVAHVGFRDGVNPSLITYLARAAKRAIMLPDDDYYRLLRDYLATEDDTEADRLLGRVLAAGAKLDGAQ